MLYIVIRPQYRAYMYVYCPRGGFRHFEKEVPPGFSQKKGVLGHYLSLFIITYEKDKFSNKKEDANPLAPLESPTVSVRLGSRNSEMG